MNRSFLDFGIVLAKRNFGEADRIYSVFSNSHGRLSLLAKGVRRPSSRKRGHLDIFNLVKFQASHGKGIDLITEAEVIKDYSVLKKDLKKVAVGYFVNEAVGKTTQERERHSEIFQILESTLDELLISDNLKPIRNAFTVELLTRLGYWPRGVSLPKPDEKLEEVIERQMYSIRVGKKLQ